MNIKTEYPLTLISLLFDIFIAALPGYWWYYSIGKLAIIQDSPFQIYVSFFDHDLILLKFINVFLFAFRFYIIGISAYYIYLLFKGKKNTLLTITWISYFYILDPIIMFLLFNYALTYIIPVHYNFFIIGKENIVIQSGNYTISTFIESYPTEEYIIAIIVGSINLASKILKSV
ncbi:hypothetical protein DFR86_01575 [Acidianus sulfidivorans JP7]|uniref:Uncharacterized protein n=1 Tax=Acidianus sulfidivorans JP7 TaxID=619593 RepID=A0A2U9IK53_9CREN|nr:hypothetical protein [Acidianus sulfidivorans]AWR96365.1 hypothetical protein DFR86_01575 [Acidianus sulfidivorans JP7]